MDESQEPSEGQDLTLAQALVRSKVVKTPERIEAKVDAAGRPYEKYDEPRPDAISPEKGR